jgi:CRISPR-associated protein (Cas_Cmr3)
MVPLSAGPPGAREVEEDEEDLWVDGTLLSEILAGAPPSEGNLRGELRERGDFYRAEPRPGLAMRNATQTAAPGRLFTRPYRRFRRSADGSRSAGFQAWYRVPGLDGRPPEGFDGTGFLGGDRRRARFTFRAAEAPLEETRRKVEAAAPEGEGWLAYLLTPAVASAAGIVLGGQAPLASALGRAWAASGWSGSAKATGPRPILTLLPAGSVFFFAWPQGADSAAARAELLSRHWLASLSPDHANSGFGRVLTGVWRR